MNKTPYKDLFPRQINSAEYMIAAEILLLEYKNRKSEGGLDVKLLISNPIVVLYSLCIELNLKAVLLAENANNKYQKCHNIEALFNAIHNVEYVNYVKAGFDDVLFNQLLNKFSNAFVEIRYIWENLHSKGQVNISSSSDIEFIRNLAKRVLDGFPIIRKNYDNL